MVDIIIGRDISGNILDLGGGGEGVIGRIYGRAVTAIDIRREELDEAPGDFKRLCMDARRLEFPDGCFDAVTAFYFLMYLPPEDRPRVFAEAARVLKSGGCMYVWDREYASAFPQPQLAGLAVDAAGERIETTYGVLGEGMSLGRDEMARCAAAAGLKLSCERRKGEDIYMVFSKNETNEVLITPAANCSLDEALTLYSAVGWTNYTSQPDMLRRALAGSLALFEARCEGRLVGLVRAVGDGASVLYIQDLLVLPEYQRRGIGSRLLSALIEQFPDVYQTVLLTDNTPEHAAFYESAGFVNAAGGGCGTYVIFR